MNSVAPRTDLYQRDFKRILKVCDEIREQVGYFERNTSDGADDSLRSLLIHTKAMWVMYHAGLAERRWYRENPQHDYRIHKERR